MKIIDFHIHYLPGSVSEERIIAAMSRLGIEKSVVLATPNHPRYTQCGLLGNNDEVMALVSRHPEHLIAAAYIEPRNILEAQTAIETFYDRGVRLVKMWPGHGFSPDDPMIYPVWEKLNQLKMGVILHSGSLGNRPALGLGINRQSGFNAKFGQPFLLDQPARYFPDVTFIIAHAAYPWTLEALEMSYMFENIYIDFSCPLGYEGYNLIDRLHPGRLPWKRMLFASDTAGLAEDFVRNWQKLMDNPFFTTHSEDFFHGNAENLLKQLFAS